MAESPQPTVVLVHGAFADASGFGGIIRELSASGYRVFAPPNPLRSLAGDAATVSAVISAIEGALLQSRAQRSVQLLRDTEAELVRRLTRG